MKSNIYSARDISQYIIDYSNKIGSPVSNLKLQKLLYYVQANFIINKGKPCFSNEIEHWRHGPVVREIYSEYKSFFNDDIKLFFYNYGYISVNDKKSINKVVDSYRSFNPWEMVERTHEEKPWLDTNKDEIISISKIKEYFSKNKERILGN